VALCALYSLLSRLQQRHELWRKVCLGLLFGGVTIAGMMMPLHYAPGIIFDGRSIVLTLAGLFGGGICAAIAAVLAGAYRAFLGGAGIWAGLATIAVTPFLAFSLWHWNCRPPRHADLPVAPSLAWRTNRDSKHLAAGHAGLSGYHFGYWAPYRE